MGVIQKMLKAPKPKDIDWQKSMIIRMIEGEQAPFAAKKIFSRSTLLFLLLTCIKVVSAQHAQWTGKNKYFWLFQTGLQTHHLQFSIIVIETRLGQCLNHWTCSKFYIVPAVREPEHLLRCSGALIESLCVLICAMRHRHGIRRNYQSMGGFTI